LRETETPGGNARGFLLEADAEGRPRLKARHRPEVGSLQADWFDTEQRRRVAGGKRQLLARAVGIGRRAPLTVLDATGGLGRDAHVLASLGAMVCLAERQPLIFALLESAWQDCQHRTPEVAARLSLHAGDAFELLQSGQGWDVVYLDPMYPHRRKQALPGKDMQFFRELTGGDPDADGLLAPARRCARWRVVVKRPLNAQPLAAVEPDQCLRGSQARFDLYLSPPCAT
jgi:16S rRNA (guanine1516-N2)-methyltransferase